MDKGCQGSIEGFWRSYWNFSHTYNEVGGHAFASEYARNADVIEIKRKEK